MKQTFTYTDKFVVEYCCQCGVPFAMSQDFYNRRRDDGEWFYCPSGHRQHYAESTVKTLERELAIERQRHDQTKARLRDTRDDRDAVTRSLRSTKGQVTKLKNRAKNGVCPCCTRHFNDLERHMKTKHPDFGVDQ